MRSQAGAWSARRGNEEEREKFCIVNLFLPHVILDRNTQIACWIYA